MGQATSPYKGMSELKVGPSLQMSEMGSWANQNPQTALNSPKSLGVERVKCIKGISKGYPVIAQICLSLPVYALLVLLCMPAGMPSACHMSHSCAQRQY